MMPGPRAAPNCFPFPEHRTMARVMLDEYRELVKRAARTSRPGARRARKGRGKRP
jgi:hypothetical protein